MIRWRPPGPYEVAFSTREGGVSEGPFASLNLGRMSGDDVDRVDENRRRLCAEIGADPLRLALNRQVHSTLVHRAEPGARGEPGDGLWTEEPDLPLLALTADCCPDRARSSGRRPSGRRRPPRRLAGPARGDRCSGSEGARRAAPRGGRSRDRPVLLRGGLRSGRAVRGCVRAATCCAAGSSISGAQPTARCERPASKRSNGSTSAPIAIRSSSSRIGAPACRGAARE